jgi:hypothetical protein
MKKEENITAVRPARRRTVWILVAVVVVMAALLIWSVAENLRFQIQTVLADGHAMMIEEMRDAALESTNVTAVADSLRRVSRFYASPKADTNRSPAERLLRRVRSGSEREIIAHLRRLTGKDIGDTPARWIEAYAPPER